ncbi:unnamed protein product, partial [Wuchereria bancrofti]
MRLFQSSGVTAAVPKVNVRRLSPKPLSCKNFDIPKAYIKYRVRLNEEMDSILEYDVDEEDMEWLSLISKKLEKAGEERLSVHSFEIAMDRLEKESFFQESQFCLNQNKTAKHLTLMLDSYFTSIFCKNFPGNFREKSFLGVWQWRMFDFYVMFKLSLTCSKGDGNYKCLVDQDAVCCVCND